jgi:hypothetical protein
VRFAFKRRLWPLSWHWLDEVRYLEVLVVVWVGPGCWSRRVCGETRPLERICNKCHTTTVSVRTTNCNCKWLVNSRAATVWAGNEV